MKKINFITLFSAAALLLGTCTASAQFVTKHGSEDFKIGVAGFSFRNFNIDETLKMMKQMGLKGGKKRKFPKFPMGGMGGMNGMGGFPM